MQCPFCRAEMKDGSLVAGQAQGFLWMPAERVPKSFAEFTKMLLAGPNVEKKYDTVWLQKSMDSDLYVSPLEVSVCWNCGKGVVDIPAKPQD